MIKLISLELKRNSLKSYHIAVAIITVIMLGFLYLLAAIPKMDPADTDAELFMSYNFIIGLSNVVCMAVFSIMSAVMASKFIVEEYTGKKAILLFSYPIEREKILEAKILMVFSYTAFSMIVCGGFILTVFLGTERLFPLCSDTISLGMIWDDILSLLCCSFIAAMLGVISLWFGFVKKSISVTIVASCIIVSVICQIMGMSLFYRPVIISALAATLFIAVLALSNLHYQVKRMEV